MRSFGFTLIELLITLCVLAILLSVALPSFSSQIRNSRVNIAVLDLQEAISLTRNTAVSTNNRTTMTKKTNWKDGWEIFIDTNNNGIRDGDEKTLQQHEELKGVRISGNGPVKNNLSYIGTGESRNAGGTNGGGFQAGTIKICPDEKGRGFELVLARGGRIRKNEISIEDCETIRQ